MAIELSESVYKSVERILDEESAWIARPSKEVTRRIALAATIAAHHIIEEQAKPLPSSPMTDTPRVTAGIFGYYDDPRATEPAFDPGLEVPCPCCLLPLSDEPLATDPLTTISLLGDGDNRSYFFRAHKRCWANATPDEKQRIESSIIDSSLTRLGLMEG